ncbi:glycosyl transferase [Catenulispora yoronensis]|uniref:Glycosyl transferase n=1 Tax=Catenulispora yoronensis TaxID=450799 RepID=A0ABP5F974_9ACTN
MSAVRPLKPRAVTAPSFAHLRRLSDDTGLFEHARGALPRREHGYCLDDVARGLLVICREPEPDAALVALAETYLAFVAHAQSPEGAFHNRLGYDRLWHDEPGVGDWWGRALWGLGTAAARGPTSWIRESALTMFESGAALRSPWVRSTAFAALGAAEILAVMPGHDIAAKLLADAADLDKAPSGNLSWPWPEERLDYANAVLAEVQIAAGHLLHDEQRLDHGLALLGWLLTQETVDGHLSLTPVGGNGHSDPQPGFDQQPIEAAAMADACARAYAVTGDERWAAGVSLAVGWFLGENDSGFALTDEHTGGGCDGLERNGRNENQGAESTLALIAALQHRRRFAKQLASASRRPLKTRD